MVDFPTEPVVTSFIIETSAGGLPITLCACGLLMYQPMAVVHMGTCSTYRRLHMDSLAATMDQTVVDE